MGEAAGGGRPLPPGTAGPRGHSPPGLVSAGAGGAGPVQDLPPRVRLSPQERVGRAWLPPFQGGAWLGA